jgi:hypothetical protein
VLVFRKGMTGELQAVRERRRIAAKALRHNTGQ